MNTRGLLLHRNFANNSESMDRLIKLLTWDPGKRDTNAADLANIVRVLGRFEARHPISHPKGRVSGHEVIVVVAAKDSFSR